MFCNRIREKAKSRREMLLQTANGFGAVALSALLSEKSYGFENKIQSQNVFPLSKNNLHVSPKAKNVIFLYMDGGPSQMDTFDPKPLLAKEHGQKFKMKVQPTQFDEVGNVLKSPWKFNQYGESGLPVSDLFPHVAKHIDDLCVIRSMTSNFSEHTNANYFLHTGHGLQGRPSMGSWVTYGLGTESRNLPGFIVLNGGLIPPGGIDCFHNGFLPATFQGSLFKKGKVPVSDINPKETTPELQKRKLALLNKLDQESQVNSHKHEEIESAIKNYELAFRMQSSVPELMQIDSESKTTQKLYGLDHKFQHTRTFGYQCLVARRLIERGVRFIELTCPKVKADRWDQHGKLKDGHEKNSLAVDQPIAALIQDLKAKGLLEETLIVWAGEFGRTPMAQGVDGRDHNPYGFTIWMAGGGVKGGMTYGATDEYGYYAIENKLEIHDLHATILYLLGIEHTKLTYRFSGRDMRLTDVHGKIIHDIIS